MGKIKKKDIGLIIFSMVGAMIVFLVVWLVYNMLTPKVTNSSTEMKKTEHSAIKCTATAPEGAFFEAKQGVSTQTQTIKISFLDDVMDKVFYEYAGEYIDEEAAEKASTLLHIDYNEYMGPDAESLMPAFAATAEKVHINLIAKQEKLNEKNARIFFLNKDETNDVIKKGPEEIERIYEARGFSCQIDE